MEHLVGDLAEQYKVLFGLGDLPDAVRTHFVTSRAKESKDIELLKHLLLYNMNTNDNCLYLK